MAKKLSFTDFVDKAKKVHGNSFTYYQGTYINTHTLTKIKCNACGHIFWQMPYSHLAGHGCLKCSGLALKTTEEVIDNFKKLNPNLDYSQVKYINSTTKIDIICKKHGIFQTTPNNFMKHPICPKCSNEEKGKNATLPFKEFVERANKRHNKQYAYNESTYVKTHEKMEITHKLCGNIFWQTPNAHLLGQGCPFCSANKSKLEEEVKVKLNEENINYIWQYSSKQLGKLSLDFYLPNENIAIECQGIQHYMPIERFFKNNIEAFQKQLERDKRKQYICKENNVKLLYFTHFKNVNEDEITFKDIDNLIKEIKNAKKN